MAGLTACSPAKEIVPYVRQPEIIVPGRPLYYATALSSGGYGIGAVVESHEGRPTKIEGNPAHPGSRGATDAIMQAAVLGLFDPERSRAPLRAGEPAAYGDFLADMAELGARLSRTHGESCAILIENATSPTLKVQIAQLRTRYRSLRIYRHDALATPAAEDVSEALFGRSCVPVYHFDKAEVIVSLDSDFLAEGPGRLGYAREFADGRRVRAPDDLMSRFFAVASTPTITAAAADYRATVRPGEVERLAAAMAEAAGVVAAGATPKTNLPLWFAAAADALKAAGPRGLIVSGEQQSAYVHAMALAINAHFGAFGSTVDLIAPPHAMPVDGDLATLCKEIEAGAVDTLLILGGNPAATAPADIDAAKALERLQLLVHCGLYRDQTATLARWHIPAAHDLEAWSDLRAYDGTVSIVQPLIAPLFGGRTFHEILAALQGDFNPDPLSLIRATWANSVDDASWRKALRDGVVPDTAAAPVAIPADYDTSNFKLRSAGQGMEIRIVADPYLRDGRHANSAMLQELPHPLTKVVWSNVVMVSPTTAARVGISNAQTLRVIRNGHQIEGSAWIMPGHPDETVTLTLGREQHPVGSVAAMAAGYDAFRLRTSENLWFADGVELVAGENVAQIATTQEHQTMEGRAIVHFTSLEHFRQEPGFVRNGVPPPPAESDLSRLALPRRSLGDVNRPVGLHRLHGLRIRLPGGKQHSHRRAGTNARAGPRDALAARRPLLSRAAGNARDNVSSRCPACTARKRLARSYARSTPRSTPMMGSMRRSITAASAHAIARRTALTRCGVSTSSSIRSSTRKRPGRDRLRATLMSRCARAA